MRRFLFLGMIFSSVFIVSPFAQDFGFGFGGAEDPADPAGGGDAPHTLASGAAYGAAISGEVSASMTGYVDDFSESLSRVKLGNIFSGKLNFSAAVPMAEGVINLKLRPASTPVSVDEAYVRAYFGSFDIEAGLRKLTWGKADSTGPLDVINPLDSSEIYPEMADSSDLMDIKIARPLVHASWRFGRFSKLEGVFVPNFEPHRFAETGHWASAQTGMLSLAEAPDTEGLDYAQGGLRFTTTMGSSDVGVQYYYGRLPKPAAKIRTDPTLSAELLYNPYHQIGLDYARVIYGFNVRAEFAANITEDLKGDDGSVYNPALAWSLGFDRDLFFGINLNVQADETIRLMDGKITGGSDPISAMGGNFDIEGGTDPTATRITATLSRKFLRDELELRASGVWGIEDQDFLIMPALMWTRDAIKIACSGGVFGGDTEGQLGQYHKSNFVKIGVTYSF
jgi:hypothetical protein